MRSLILLPYLALAALAAHAAASTPAPVNATALKQQNAAAKAENDLITKEMAAASAKDWPKAEGIAQTLVKAEPDNWQYRRALADARFEQGHYAESAEDYAAALLLAEKAKLDPKLKDAMAAMYVNEGNAYLKLKRPDDALVAYRKAASLDSHPATAWFNLCAVDYNLGKVDAALADCDRAIAADPSRADAYFIEGSLLVGNATMDAAGKPVAPPGTAAALQQYLKLAPTGPHAADVRQMLQFLGAPAS